MSVGGRLEEAIVEHVPQGLRERTQHLLLRLPHRGIRIEAQALLQGERGQGGASREERRDRKKDDRGSWSDKK